MTVSFKKKLGMDSSLSDLVIDSRIQVEFSSNFTYRFTFQSRVVWYENDDSVFIVMEYMEYGDLASHLKRPLPENEAREITLQIAEGLKLLHENGFAHRDLKPAVKSPSSRTEKIIANKSRISLSSAKALIGGSKLVILVYSKRVDEKDALLQSCVGTPIFLAPEVHIFSSSGRNDHGTVLQYTKKVDIWALGVLTFYMIFHDYPFSPGKSITLQRYMEGEDFPFPTSRLPSISKACKSFIKAAMAADASERLSAKQLTENEWLMLPDLQIVEMASVRIKKEKFPYSISTEVSEEVLEPVQKHTSDDSSNGNRYPPGGNIRADVPPNSLESSARKESTAVKFDPSETRNDSPSYKNAMQSQLKELKSLHSQGMEHFRQDDFKKAEFMLRQAAEGREKLRGLMCKETRKSYHWLGVLYYHMSKYSQAKQLFQRVLDYRERIYGPKGISTLESRYWIGVLTIQEGNNQEGLSILRQVVEVQKESRAKSPRNPSFAFCN
jgi:serine/threonine protein kinase